MRLKRINLTPSWLEWRTSPSNGAANGSTRLNVPIGVEFDDREDRW
jgi:hypothetical protein